MKSTFEKEFPGEPGHELASKSEDRFFALVHGIVRIAVKVLAVLTVAVIVWGIGEVVHVLYQRFTDVPAQH